MIIPIELRFKADKDSKSAFRTDKTIKSHDVNSVEFHISIDGLELTGNHTAKILSIFHSSKSQANVDCEIIEGKIIYKPDTKLISRHEHVTNYVYVYNGNQSLDVREFIYIVDLSKIDETSLEVKEVYDQSYADLLADFEQALSDYKDNLPQADSVRTEIDEILNQFSVDSQAKLSQYDTDAQQVITDNQTAFNLAESVRQEDFDTSQSEKQQRFDDAQSARQESYEQTQSLINEAESSRVQAEGQRESAESIRKANEFDRVQAENERQTTFETNESERDGTFNANEAKRQGNESTRQRAETQRASAESSRVSAEADRVLAEDERENSEEQRKTDHANRSAELDGKADKKQEDWITPTMSSGATAKEGYPVGYMKDEMGFVHFRGKLIMPSYGRLAFNLPVGYRPSSITDFLCYVYLNKLGKVTIQSTGGVYPSFPYDANSEYDLSSITFKAER